MIQIKQKLILTFGMAIVLISIFFTGKNVPAVASTAKEIYYYEGGYFTNIDKNKFWGPGCDIYIEKKRLNKDSPWYDTKELRDGTNGYFTKELACNEVYGSPYVPGVEFTNVDVPVDMYNACGISYKRFHKVECITLLDAPCAVLVDGVCQKVDTSILQGADKNKGKFSTNPPEFIIRVFTIILSFAGGIALLLIISAGYKIVMSKGKPEAIQQGKDQLGSAIVGLIFVIFSFVVIQVVFVEILKIPGFIK